MHSVTSLPSFRTQAHTDEPLCCGWILNGQSTLTNFACENAIDQIATRITLNDDDRAPPQQLRTPTVVVTCSQCDDLLNGTTAASQCGRESIGGLSHRQPRGRFFFYLFQSALFIYNCVFVCGSGTLASAENGGRSRYYDDDERKSFISRCYTTRRAQRHTSTHYARSLSNREVHKNQIDVVARQ